MSASHQAQAVQHPQVQQLPGTPQLPAPRWSTVVAPVLALQHRDTSGITKEAHDVPTSLPWQCVYASPVALVVV